MSAGLARARFGARIRCRAIRQQSVLFFPLIGLVMLAWIEGRAVLEPVRNEELVPMIAGPEGGPSSDMQRYEG